MNPIQPNQTNGLTYGHYATTINRITREREYRYIKVTVGLTCIVALIIAVANFRFSITNYINHPNIAARLDPECVLHETSDMSDPILYLFNGIFGTVLYPIIPVILFFNFGLRIINDKLKKFKENDFDKHYQPADMLQSQDIRTLMSKLSKDEKKTFIENMNFSQLYSVRQTMNRKEFEMLIQDCQKTDHIQWKNIFRLIPESTTESVDFSRYQFDDSFPYKVWKEEAISVGHTLFQKQNSFLASRPNLEASDNRIVLVRGLRQVEIDLDVLERFCGTIFHNSGLPVVEQIVKKITEDEAVLEFLEVCSSPEKDVTPEVATRVLPMALRYESKAITNWLVEVILDSRPILSNELVKAHPFTFRKAVEQRVLSSPLNLDNCQKLYKIAAQMSSYYIMGKCQEFVLLQIDPLNCGERFVKPQWLAVAEKVLDKEKIEQVLIERLEIRNLRSLYDLSDRFGYEGLRQKCIEFCKLHTQEVKDQASWKMNEIIPNIIADTLYPAPQTTQPW